LLKPPTVRVTGRGETGCPSVSRRFLASAWLAVRSSAPARRVRIVEKILLPTKILRHTAALALAGWYLILPNPLLDGSPDTNAPLSAWSQSGIFDRAADCEQANLKLIQRARQQLSRFEKQIDSSPKNSGPTTEAAAALSTKYNDIKAGAMRALFSQCVSSDDPRLRE